MSIWDKRKRYEDPYDVYITDDRAIKAILEREHLFGNVLDAGVGPGTIIDIVQRHCPDVKNCYGVDIRQGYTIWPNAIHANFITEPSKLPGDIDFVISNPPFKLAVEFVIRGLEVAKEKVLIFQRLAFLESLKRYERLYAYDKLEAVYTFVRRMQCFKEDEPDKNQGGKITFAWYVFNPKKKRKEFPSYTGYWLNV